MTYKKCDTGKDLCVSDFDKGGTMGVSGEDGGEDCGGTGCVQGTSCWAGVGVCKGGEIGLVLCIVWSGFLNIGGVFRIFEVT
mmetsp:Transcript_3071/g.4713  ORF Transcript_3071/g.4713 Transcript_3071/m.4713 type:complete len:82 (-) Transcript_3071:112-357(-)